MRGRISSPGSFDSGKFRVRGPFRHDSISNFQIRLFLLIRRRSTYYYIQFRRKYRLACPRPDRRLFHVTIRPPDTTCSPISPLFPVFDVLRAKFNIIHNTIQYNSVRVTVVAKRFSVYAGEHARVLKCGSVISEICMGHKIHFTDGQTILGQHILKKNVPGQYITKQK